MTSIGDEDKTRKLIAIFGKRNRLINFLEEIKGLQKKYPEEVNSILLASLNGDFEKEENNIQKNYEVKTRELNE